MADNLKLERADVEAKMDATELAYAKVIRKGRASSLTTAVIVHLIIGLLLGLVFILPEPEDIPAIVAVSDELDKPDNLDKKEFARSVKQKPTPAQSASKVKPILAQNISSSFSVPSVEDPVEDPLGIGVHFGRGFGHGRGKGDGGGGVSFFGAPSQAERVVYIVDFSDSMKEADLAGGTRLDRLKTELIRSISKLPKGMPFQVIYYSTDAWLGGETLYTAPTRFADDPSHRVPWSKATKEGIDRAVAQVKAAQPEGATLWGPPLELAMAMKPPPSDVYLLSDGAAQDGDEVLSEIRQINPTNIPIHAIGLELAGQGFKTLVDIARITGGTYSIVFKGKLYSGAAALRYAKDEFDVDSEFDF